MTVCAVVGRAAGMAAGSSGRMVPFSPWTRRVGQVIRDHSLQ
jgi:hypothetical protein